MPLIHCHSIIMSRKVVHCHCLMLLLCRINIRTKVSLSLNSELHIITNKCTATTWLNMKCSIHCLYTKSWPSVQFSILLFYFIQSFDYETFLVTGYFYALLEPTTYFMLLLTLMTELHLLWKRNWTFNFFLIFPFDALQNYSDGWWPDCLLPFCVVGLFPCQSSLQLLCSVP